jgi:hypothetical protein
LNAGRVVDGFAFEDGLSMIILEEDGIQIVGGECVLKKQYMTVFQIEMAITRRRSSPRLKR